MHNYPVSSSQSFRWPRLKKIDKVNHSRIFSDSLCRERNDERGVWAPDVLTHDGIGYFSPSATGSGTSFLTLPPQTCLDHTGEAVEEIGPSLKKKFSGIVRFEITNTGTWTLDLKTGNGAVTTGEGSVKPDLVIKVADDDFASLYEGKSNAQQAFMKGKLKVKGNMSLAMKFNQVLTATRKQLEKTKKKKTAGAVAAAVSTSAAPKAQVVFDQLAEVLPTKGAALVAKMKGVIQWDINGEKWLLDLKNGTGSLSKGTGPADLTVTMADDVFFQVSQGKLSAQQAFMKGQIKIKGNMGMATKLGPILTAARPTARL